MKTVPKEAVLSFRIISYRVKEKIGFLHGWKTVETEVLSNIKYVHKLNRPLYAPAVNFTGFPITSFAYY
jgi:hypothetical protein